MFCNNFLNLPHYKIIAINCIIHITYIKECRFSEGNMHTVDIGIIGGSGLYNISGIKKIDEENIKTPWGYPSDTITIAELDGIKLAFLPRHARGHKFTPSEINTPANIAALKMLGAHSIISFSAAGSLKEELKPQDFVIPSQIIDRTKERPATFFGNGIVAHISFGHPFCESLSNKIIQAAEKIKINFHTNETLICMEGPAFSTIAESNLYRSWGAGVINMSTLPEAKLAREAEMCYTAICMITDYDCWREGTDQVTVEAIVENMTTNSANAHILIKEAIPLIMDNHKNCSCQEAIKNAVLTTRKMWPANTRKKLSKIHPKYFR